MLPAAGGWVGPRLRLISIFAARCARRRAMLPWLRGIAARRRRYWLAQLLQQQDERAAEGGRCGHVVLTGEPSERVACLRADVDLKSGHGRWSRWPNHISNIGFK